MTTKVVSPIPVPALFLGLAGLIPFVSLAILSFLYSGLVKSEVVFALIAYGAVILSFLGGVHWGLALGVEGQLGWSRLIVSVIPSLFGWVALLVANHMAFMLLLFCFAGMLVIDISAVRSQVFPQWYLRLRWILTTVVCISLAISLVGIQ